MLPTAPRLLEEPRPRPDPDRGWGGKDGNCDAEVVGVGGIEDGAILMPVRGSTCCEKENDKNTAKNLGSSLIY